MKEEMVMKIYIQRKEKKHEANFAQTITRLQVQRVTADSAKECMKPGILNGEGEQRARKDI